MEKLDHVTLMMVVIAISRVYKPVLHFPVTELQYRTVNSDRQTLLAWNPHCYFYQRYIAGVDSDMQGLGKGFSEWDKWCAVKCTAHHSYHGLIQCQWSNWHLNIYEGKNTCRYRITGTHLVYFAAARLLRFPLIYRCCMSRNSYISENKACGRRPWRVKCIVSFHWNLIHYIQYMEWVSQKGKRQLWWVVLVFFYSCPCHGNSLKKGERELILSKLIKQLDEKYRSLLAHPAVQVNDSWTVWLNVSSRGNYTSSDATAAIKRKELVTKARQN